jgi:lysozyme family protein
MGERGKGMNRLQVLSQWRECKIMDAKRAVVSQAAKAAWTYRSSYKMVGDPLGIPWYMIGALHMRESNFNFATYLGNGDPLFNHAGHPVQSVHVPERRGPFSTWEAGAEDALTLGKWNVLPDGWHWDIVTALIRAEVWNGLAYSRRDMPSPYVWAQTNIQVPGKYVRDHVFDPQAWDSQVGVAALWIALRDEHGVDLNEK